MIEAKTALIAVVLDVFVEVLRRLLCRKEVIK